MDTAPWSDDAPWEASSDDEAILEAALRLIETTPLAHEAEARAVPSQSADAGCPSLEVRFKIGRPQHQTHPEAVVTTHDVPRRRRGRPRTTTSTASLPRRNRTKDAIEQLRPLVVALEAQLEALLQQRTVPGQSVDEGDPDRTLVRREAWKAMAERQLVQRRRVESEKQLLLETLVEQTATIRKLQRLFAHHQNRLRAGMYQSLTPTSPVSVAMSHTQPGLSDVVQSLTLALGQMHFHTDAVLADARFVAPGSSFVQVKTESEPLNGTLAVQLMDTRVVPFGMERTAEAVWMNLLNRANQATPMPLTQDVVQSHFVTYVPGFDGRVDAAMALRRVVEPDRVVMVRCSVFSYHRASTADDDTAPASMTLHHFLWTAVSRPQGSDDADDCQIQTCFISVPSLGDSDRDREKTTAVTQLCADVSKYFNADAHDEVDTILLRGSVL